MVECVQIYAIIIIIIPVRRLCFYSCWWGREDEEYHDFMSVLLSIFKLHLLKDKPMLVPVRSVCTHEVMSRNPSWLAVQRRPMLWCIGLFLFFICSQFDMLLIWFVLVSPGVFSWLNSVTIKKDEVSKLVYNLKGLHMLSVVINAFYSSLFWGDIGMSETRLFCFFSLLWIKQKIVKPV